MAGASDRAGLSISDARPQTLPVGRYPSDATRQTRFTHMRVASGTPPPLDEKMNLRA